MTSTVSFTCLVFALIVSLAAAESESSSSSSYLLPTLIIGAIVFVIFKVLGRKSAEEVGVIGLQGSGVSKEEVKSTIDTYENYFDGSEATPDKRKEKYTSMINNYYDLVTDFYEYGWGQSFHFAPRHAKESLEESLYRHEYFLSHKLGLKPGMKVLDFGCGVGGPMRNIARFSGASVTGLNNNGYQIMRGTKQVENAKLDKLCNFIKCDFMKVPVPDQSYDAAYGIEAIVHAPDKVAIYNEVFRCLKPGGVFACYEWLLTPKFDASNSTHVAIKKGVERGNGIADLVSISHTLESLKAAGFVVEEHDDIAHNPEWKKLNPIPWYDPLDGKLTINGFKHTRPGRIFTTIMVTILENLRLAPKGTIQTQQMLCGAADSLVAGGKLEIFTPAFFFVARKPLH